MFIFVRRFPNYWVNVLKIQIDLKNYILQAKFLPLSGDCHIVSCARDGQVRLAVLSNTGVCKNTRLLARHRRPTHKLATHPATPHVFLSAGEDALVLSHDVRLSKSNK